MEPSAESTLRKMKAAKARKAKKDDSATVPSQSKRKRPRKAQKESMEKKTLNELVENTKTAFSLLDGPERLPESASRVGDSAENGLEDPDEYTVDLVDFYL